MAKTIIGMIEHVEIGGRMYRARIDTGARRSSIDKKIAKHLDLGPVIRKTKVTSVHGVSVRPVIRTPVKIRNRTIKATFNLADRKSMKHSVLIGRNVLKSGFLIDTTL